MRSPHNSAPSRETEIYLVQYGSEFLMDNNGYKNDLSHPEDGHEMLTTSQQASQSAAQGSLQATLGMHRATRQSARTRHTPTRSSHTCARRQRSMDPRARALTRPTSTLQLIISWCGVSLDFQSREAVTPSQLHLYIS